MRRRQIYATLAQPIVEVTPQIPEPPPGKACPHCERVLTRGYWSHVKHCKAEHDNQRVG